MVVVFRDITEQKRSAETTNRLAAIVEFSDDAIVSKNLGGIILANLFSNALKFVAPGVQPHVRFWAEDRSEFSRLWVEDNGIGLPAHQHDRVFRVFERLHGSRYVGTGIAFPSSAKAPNA